MNTMKDTNLAIAALVNAQFANPTGFETFTTQLIALGVSRFNFDALENEMHFYTNDEFIYSLKRADLIDAQKNTHWIAGDTLNTPELENAIKMLDEGKISAVEFHRIMFLAGVVFCCVYLTPRKIYYLGQDGQHYIENY